MSEEPKATAEYDFDFICRALNLLPYGGIEGHAPFNNVKGAVNVSAITNLRVKHDNFVVLTLYGGVEITMNGENLAELEALVRRRQKEGQEAQAAAIQREADLRVQAELNAAQRAMQSAAVAAQLSKGKRGT